MLTRFKSLHAVVAEMNKSTQPDLVSVTPDCTFISSDIRRLLPRDRVNMVGSISTDGVTVAAGEGDAAGKVLSAAAWDELRAQLQRLENEKADIELKATMQTDQLKRKLVESERRTHDLKKTLKRVAPNSSK